MGIISYFFSIFKEYEPTEKDKKSDKLNTILKQAKKKEALNNKAFWKRMEAERKKEKRILEFVLNGVCPECGNKVKHSASVDVTYTTDNHYKCIACTFETHSYCDDEDDWD